ncbi:MAG: formate dehydrogenase accessory sulfurtransferase FdhD [Chitinophagaceae bacterium]|nr:formate dehydrogenase accessory sulfurtransferase FdhD [Chitinophagaceae bacterium]
MQSGSVAPVAIERFKNGRRQAEKDLLAVEEPMEIRLDHGSVAERRSQPISVTMRTPGNDFELALGFLFTEAIISSADDVHMIRYCTDMQTHENRNNIVRVYLKENVVVDIDRLKRNFYTSSSCGVCGKESIESVRIQCNPVLQTGIQVLPETILSLPGTLRKKQNVFEYTGGLHASALFDLSGNLILLREDIGRHNALDKLIGAAHAGKNRQADPACGILLLSGRASFELLQKAAMASVPIVCAVGAPSSLAVQIAKAFGITLIGFLRDERFNIYCGEERIKKMEQ